MRNKFVYFCSIKIHASGFKELLESALCLLMVVEVFSLQKVFKIHVEVVVGWWEVRWIWQMRQNFLAHYIQLLKCCLCDMHSGIVMENWALSVDQCWLQALQFLVHLIDFLSIRLRGNSPPGLRKLQWIRWAADHQTVIVTIFCSKFSFGKCFGASSLSNHWAGHHRLSYKIQFSSHITVWSRNDSLLLHRIREDNT